VKTATRRGLQGRLKVLSVDAEQSLVVSAALSRAIDQPDVRAKFSGVVAEVSPLGAEAFGAFVRAENEKWARLIRARKLQLD
jgi:tripartite-type tricarboxylate transporter receptor subunit TctC